MWDMIEVTILGACKMAQPSVSCYLKSLENDLPNCSSILRILVFGLSCGPLTSTADPGDDPSQALTGQH